MHCFNLQVILKYSVCTYISDSTVFKVAYPSVQIQFPHIKCNNHQIKYRFYSCMTVAVFCVIIRFELMKTIFFYIPSFMHDLS